MTPEQLAKANTEHSHQKALFAWAAMACKYGFLAADDRNSYSVKGYAEQLRTKGKSIPVPELEWLHAIPNGGPRDAVAGAKLKAEGVKRGVSDIFLPLPMRENGNVICCGLYIELKRPASGKGDQRKAKGQLSKEQIAFMDYVNSAGYKAVVCEGWVEAAILIQDYVIFNFFAVRLKLNCLSDNFVQK